MFPGLCTKNEVPAALWFAQEFPAGQEIPTGLSHPERIRRWANEQQATQALPEPLQTITPTSTPVLAQRDAASFASKGAGREDDPACGFGGRRCRDCQEACSSCASAGTSARAGPTNSSRLPTGRRRLSRFAPMSGRRRGRRGSPPSIGGHRTNPFQINDLPKTTPETPRRNPREGARLPRGW